MSKKGIIFNIQKFSIHDGPGIRTTVFLKGCPLRCKWCSNPESQLSKVQILYDQNKCIHCLSCVNNCPQKAITRTDGKIRVNFTQCQGCLTCEKNCPTKALTHEGEEKTVEEVVQVCLQDKDFYEESQGGVTISGGEGMVQPDFTEALVQSLKDRGIHTAIETTGCVSSAVFQRLAKQFDLLLFDVKQSNRDKHYAGTNVYNNQIIENLRWAVVNNINVLPRIPVIPGFNAELTDAKEISDLLVSLNIKKVQLLPFHQMGERKYEFLNRDYALTGLKALHPEDLKEYQNIFLNKGIDCFY